MVGMDAGIRKWPAGTNLVRIYPGGKGFPVVRSVVDSVLLNIQQTLANFSKTYPLFTG